MKEKRSFGNKLLTVIFAIISIVYLAILTMIATIIDPPATALNVVGDVSTAMLTARMTDGKEWMQ